MMSKSQKRNGSRAIILIFVLAAAIPFVAVFVQVMA